MGQTVSSQINRFIIQYLKTLQNSGNGTYTVDNFEKKFFLNGINSPECRICVKNSTIASLDDFCFLDEDDIYIDQQIRTTNPKIEIEIGEAVVSCEELGYTCCVSGKIKIFGLNLTATVTPTIEDGFRISDYDSKVTMRKIQPDIKLLVNGKDHSELAKAVLSANNPDLANTILNAVLLLQKETIIDLLNTHLGEIYFSS